jgi:hypothetical protein
MWWLAFALGSPAVLAVPKQEQNAVHLVCQQGPPPLHRRDREQIVAAVAQMTRAPVVQLDMPLGEDHPPTGVVVAVTMIEGHCGCSRGTRYWVRQIKGRWRVLKNAGNFFCVA